MTADQFIEDHASTLAHRLNIESAANLHDLTEQVKDAAKTADDGVAQSYSTAAMYLELYDRQPLRTRPVALASADMHLSDALAA